MKRWISFFVALCLGMALCGNAAAEDGGVLTQNASAPAVSPAFPSADATAAFPVGAAREVYIDNENARELFFTNDAPPTRLKAFIVPDAVARVRMTLAPFDNPYALACYDRSGRCLYPLIALLNESGTAYTLDVPMPREENDAPFISIRLADGADQDASDAVDVYLLPGEEALDGLCDLLAAAGWRLGEESAAASAVPEEPQAYMLYVVDQDGEPVPGVIVTFCTDLACRPAQADPSGVIAFAAEPDVYHVQVLRAPKGYGFDPDFELLTGTAYAAWQLRIQKDAAP